MTGREERVDGLADGDCKSWGGSPGVAQCRETAGRMECKINSPRASRGSQRRGWVAQQDARRVSGVREDGCCTRAEGQCQSSVASHQHWSQLPLGMGMDMDVVVGGPFLAQQSNRNPPPSFMHPLAGILPRPLSLAADSCNGSATPTSSFSDRFDRRRPSMPQFFISQSNAS